MTAAFTEDSSAGSVSRGSTLKFDASPSRDPSDPTNTLQPMRCLLMRTFCAVAMGHQQLP
eukprot:1159858-Pelagomonas_calceolata.AAC.13